jgi:hypothetical protein
MPRVKGTRRTNQVPLPAVTAPRWDAALPSSFSPNCRDAKEGS